MIARDATRIAEAFVRTELGLRLELLRTLPGVESGEDDRDRPVWNVVFRAVGDEARDPPPEVWIVVDDASGRARQARGL